MYENYDIKGVLLGVYGTREYRFAGDCQNNRIVLCLYMSEKPLASLQMMSMTSSMVQKIWH